MDNRSRDTDRADPLRTLSQEVARGAPQVLQQDLLVKPCRPASQIPRGGRTDGGSHGGESGLICEQCGADLPEGSTIRREFCGAKCRRAFYTVQRRAARAEARKTQVCLFCGGPMRDDYPQGKYYCSARCGDLSSEDMRRHRNRRSCANCAVQFMPRDERQRFCCHPCYIAARYWKPTPLSVDRGAGDSPVQEIHPSNRVST